MSSTSILVVGAGELGSSILQSLVQHPKRQGTRIAVLKRSETLPSTLHGYDIEVITSDISDVSTEKLGDLFRGFHTVVNCCGMQVEPQVQVKIFEAAQQANVKRYFPCMQTFYRPNCSADDRQGILVEITSLLEGEVLNLCSTISWMSEKHWKRNPR